jgi:hypothetical protein
MADMKQDDVDAGQRAAAESLRRQISDLQKGKTPTKSPQSLRDFLDRKMAEDRERIKKEDDARQGDTCPYKELHPTA